MTEVPQTPWEGEKTKLNKKRPQTNQPTHTNTLHFSQGINRKSSSEKQNTSNGEQFIPLSFLYHVSMFLIMYRRKTK